MRKKIDAGVQASESHSTLIGEQSDEKELISNSKCEVRKKTAFKRLE